MTKIKNVFTSTPSTILWIGWWVVIILLLVVARCDAIFGQQTQAKTAASVRLPASLPPTAVSRPTPAQ